MQQPYQDIEHIINEYPNLPVWIAGDLNLPNIDWENHAVKSNSYHISLCNIFLEFINNYGFTQVVNFSTRVNNILDIFCTNKPALLSRCYPLPGIGDHDAVAVTSHTSVKLNTPIKRKLYQQWSKVDHVRLHQMGEDLCSDFLSTYSSSTPTTILWEEFKAMCCKCLNMVPTKEATGKNRPPWMINHSIKSLSRQKQRLYNRARQSGLSDDWLRYHHIKKQSQQQCRKARNNYICNLANAQGRSVTKKLWSFIKQQK